MLPPEAVSCCTSFSISSPRAFLAAWRLTALTPGTNAIIRAQGVLSSSQPQSSTVLKFALPAVQQKFID